jgi:hypothetical protein
MLNEMTELSSLTTSSNDIKQEHLQEEDLSFCFVFNPISFLDCEYKKDIFGVTKKKEMPLQSKVPNCSSGLRKQSSTFQQKGIDVWSTVVKPISWIENF